MPGFGSPCGACKFLRRRCANGCIFAPYFRHEQGASHFAAIHKVFGASNVSKLLAHLPVHHRFEAAATISYEAQARLEDPIYGCVAHIFALQQEVLKLQAELAILQGEGILNASSNFTSVAPPSQQQKHHNLYLHQQQQFRAQDVLSNSHQDFRPAISGRTWSNVHGVGSTQPQGSNYLPSSLPCSFTENIGHGSIPFTIHEILNLRESGDLLFNMRFHVDGSTNLQEKTFINF